MFPMLRETTTVTSSVRRRPSLFVLMLQAWLLTQPVAALATEVLEKFPIERFQLEGNTLMTADALDEALGRHRGASRTMEDLYAAAETIQALYRQAGYPAVQVALPEQKLGSGVVRLKVIEGRFGSIEVKGNTIYSSQALRASLPSVKEGASPNVRRMDAELRLANENPGRRLGVNLSPGGAIGEIKARIDVSDERPQRYSTSFDNTGTTQTGIWRWGLGYQHANVADRQHVASVQFVTAPERLRDVQVLSAGYRIPLPAHAASVEAMAAYSNVKAGVTATVAGPLFFAGEGRIFGAKLTHRLDSAPESEHKLGLGFDIKDFRNDCSLGAFGAAGCGEAGASIRLRPITFSYSGSHARPAWLAQWSASYSRNISGGRGGREHDFAAARGRANPDFNIFRASASAQAPLDQWMLHLGGQWQETRDALVLAEQFGLGGAQSVRGYAERAASNDRGYVGNIEIYTPELAQRFEIPGLSLKAVGFMDRGVARRNHRLPEETGATAETWLSSVGVGLRATLGKTWSLNLDVGHVMESTAGRDRGNQRAHFSLSGAF